jgi:hypothetical protein
MQTRPNQIDLYLPTLRKWKQANWKGWKDRDKSNKAARLLELVYWFNQIKLHDEPDVRISSASHYAYNPNEAIIYIDFEKPSVISTLHEFGHHLNGASELDACGFSVWLFKEAFPKSFEQLHFEGHMLKK